MFLPLFFFFLLHSHLHVLCVHVTRVHMTQCHWSLPRFPVCPVCRRMPRPRTTLSTNQITPPASSLLCQSAKMYVRPVTAD